jgi:hypothetical protein
MSRISHNLGTSLSLWRDLFDLGSVTTGWGTSLEVATSDGEFTQRGSMGNRTLPVWTTSVWTAADWIRGGLFTEGLSVNATEIGDSTKIVESPKMAGSMETNGSIEAGFAQCNSMQDLAVSAVDRAVNVRELRGKEKMAPMAATDLAKVAAMKPHTGPAAGKQDFGG